MLYEIENTGIFCEPGIGINNKFKILTEHGWTTVMIRTPPSSSWLANDMKYAHLKSICSETLQDGSWLSYMHRAGQVIGNKVFIFREATDATWFRLVAS